MALEAPTNDRGRQAPGDRAAGLALTYFSLSFPELTQTFVFNEMRHLKALGADIDVVALRPPRGDMSNLPQLYGFGDRIAYAEPNAVTPGRVERVGLALSSAARLAVGGQGAGVLRLFGGDAERPVVARSLALRLAARFRATDRPADVVVCHFGPAGRVAASLKAMGLLPGKLVTVFHGYDLTQFIEDRPGDVYRQLFEQADLLIAISDRWRGRLIELGARPDKVVTLRLGIDGTAFDYRSRRPDPNEPIRLISVGRLTEKKGHRYALEAVATLLQRHPDLRLHFDLVGSGPLENELRDMIGLLGLEDIVTLHGGIAHEQVRRLLDRAHLLLLHSVTAADGDMEGIPVSIMEAMAMGLPVVSTRHSGIPELVAHGVSGLLVEERDVGACAQALAAALADPVRMEAMGRAGRTIIERDYDAGRQAERLLSLLTALADGDFPKRRDG